MPGDSKESARISQPDSFDPGKTMEYPEDFVDQLRALRFLGLPPVEAENPHYRGFQSGYDGHYDGRVLQRRGVTGRPS